MIVSLTEEFADIIESSIWDGNGCFIEAKPSWLSFSVSAI